MKRHQQNQREKHNEFHTKNKQSLIHISSHYVAHLITFRRNFIMYVTVTVFEEFILCFKFFSNYDSHSHFQTLHLSIRPSSYSFIHPFVCFFHSCASFIHFCHPSTIYSTHSIIYYILYVNSNTHNVIKIISTHLFGILLHVVVERLYP